MSGPAGEAPPAAVLSLGLDVRGSYQQRSVQRSGGVLIQTYLHPPPSAGGTGTTKTPLRLPSLVSGPRRRGSMARLSLSEPSLFTPNENILFEGFSCSRRSSALQRRPPAPLSFSKLSASPPNKTFPRPMSSHPHQQRLQQIQSCSRPTYIHFSHAIQPSLRPRPVRRHSHNPAFNSETVPGDLRPSAVHQRSTSSGTELLSVVGKPCLLSYSQRSTSITAAAAAAAGPSRTQLHVFLPSEADGQEVDSESVDEGFMDELDSKFSSLKLQQGATKTEME